MRFATRLALLLSTAAAWPAAAQNWDTSGNGMLKGTYYFRQVVWVITSPYSDLRNAAALYGTINFDGNGNYSISATEYNAGASGPYSIQGTYSIASSGHGFLDNPLLNDTIYGVVSQQGIFIGSSTDGNYNDLFIAAPLSSPAPTNTDFSGAYWLAEMDMSDPTSSRWSSSLFQVNPNGAGDLGTVTGTGYVAGGSGIANQSSSGVKYSFTNGAGVITFPNAPTASPLLYGTKYLYISPDRNFIFGGSPVGFDFFVGVRQASGAPVFSGIYDQAGIDEFLSQSSIVLDTYYGSFTATAGAAGCPDAGCVIGHQRVQDLLQWSNAYDYSYFESFPLPLAGSYSNTYMRYVVGAGGIRIGSGISPSLGLNVALPAPAMNGSGVFLNPLGVANVASSAPFTASVAPGEFLVLYGSNLANGYQVASVPFPTTLGGVQVLINSTPAPIYYVSASQIGVVVPLGITGFVAQIQVVNNSAPSNSITSWVSTTAPGVFTLNRNGLGYAAALHADYSLLTDSSPAKVGETVLLYVGGLGTVNPTVADGSAAPSDPLSNATNTISVYIDGLAAKVDYSGLAPGFAGLYQLNVEIPSGVTNGWLAIYGPDSAAVEASIPVGSAATSAGAAAAARRMPRSPAALHPRANPSRGRGGLGETAPSRSRL